MNKAFMAAALAAMLAPTAFAQDVSFTQETCLAYLTSPAPEGLGLDPNQIPIGTMVFGEPVFRGMHPDYLCEREVRMRETLHQKDELIASLQEEKALAIREGAQDKAYRETNEQDPFKRYARELAIACAVLFLLLVLLIPNALKGAYVDERRRRRTNKRPLRDFFDSLER